MGAAITMMRSNTRARREGSAITLRYSDYVEPVGHILLSVDPFRVGDAAYRASDGPERGKEEEQLDAKLDQRTVRN